VAKAWRKMAVEEISTLRRFEIKDVQKKNG